MSLRLKVFLFVGVTLSLLFYVLYYFFARSIAEDFRDLETAETREHVLRVKDALENKREELSTKLADWSQWDDTYAFVSDQNEEYVESNLGDDTFTLLHLQFIAILDEGGNALFKKYVSRDGEEQPFPESLGYFLSPGSVLVSHPDIQSIHGGLLAIPEGMLMLVSRPVTTSDGLSAPRGSIVFAYFVDETVLEGLAQLTHLQISAARYQGGPEADGFDGARQALTTEQAVWVESPTNETSIAGYGLVNDVFGQPVFIVRAETRREIYQHGQAAIVLFAKNFVVANALFILITFAILEGMILRKLSVLNREIRRVEDGESVALESYVSGEDEFSRVARAINGMLEKISKTAEDLKKFRQAADIGFEHMVITDPDGIILYANQAAVILTGYSVGEMTGRTPALWGRQMPPKFYETLWRTIKDEKQVYVGELTNRRKNGTKYLASVRILPILDEAGKVRFFVGIERDITEERKYQLQIVRHTAELESVNALVEKQKERAESILRFLRSIGESVYATDTEGNIIFMNEAAEMLAKQTFQSVEQEPAERIFRFVEETEKSDRPCTFVSTVLRSRSMIKFPEHTFFLYDEQKRIPVSGTCAPIRGEKGEILGVIVVFQDVTELHKLDQMKDNFLSVAAHQLRTPLGSMRWSMEMLLSGDLGRLPKTAKDTVLQLYENSQRMVLLVNDLLDVSRIDMRRGKEEKQPTDIVTLVREAARVMKSEAGKRDVTITLRLPKKNLPLLLVPPRHTYEAIENLLSNAIKYNQPEGSVTVTIIQQPDRVVLTVCDTGIGIPRSDHSKIFSKFFRASNAVLKETEGSGLGLSVVKSYLEEAGAKVWFESEEGVGTTFYVEFPAGTIHSV